MYARILGTTALLVVVAARPASAHGAPDRIVPVVEGVTPGARWLSVGVSATNAASRIEIRVQGRHAVEVAGPDDEPFARVGPDGAYVNESSAIAPLVGDAFATPTEARGEPRWRRISREPRLVWHDPRASFAGTPSRDVTSKGTRATLGQWAIPVALDGATGRIEGRVDWVPAPFDPDLVLIGGGALGVALWWLAADRTRLAQAVVLASGAGTVLELVRLARAGGLALAVTPAVGLVVGAFRGAWRRDPFAICSIAAFGLYLLGVGLVPGWLTGRIAPAGTGWVFTALGAFIAIGALVALRRQREAVDA